MDVTVLLVGGAIAVVAVIVINHQKQKNKMQNMVQESSDTQSLFLVKAVEKKNKALSDILYAGGDKTEVAADATGPKATLIKQLQKLEKEYTEKKIPLRTYDEHLFDLLEKARKLPANA